MFGNDVENEVRNRCFFPSTLLSDTDTADQISQNLLQVPGYNPTLNKLVLWMLVVTPLYGQI